MVEAHQITKYIYLTLTIVLKYCQHLNFFTMQSDPPLNIAPSANARHRDLCPLLCALTVCNGIVDLISHTFTEPS